METSAIPSGLRDSFPEKITSSSERPRRLLLDVSPKPQRNASTRFDLPDPFGPTIAVTPSPTSTTVGSANVLKPNVRICRSFISNPLRFAQPFGVAPSPSERRAEDSARRPRADYRRRVPPFLSRPMLPAPQPVARLFLTSPRHAPKSFPLR